MSQIKISLAGNNLITSRDSLVCDITAGDGKIANLLLQCSIDMEEQLKEAESFFTIIYTAHRLQTIFDLFIPKKTFAKPNSQI